MKSLIAAVFGLAVAGSATAATAYVAEVTTTIPMTSVATAQNTTELGAVVQSAIQDVLDHAIAFTPTVVVLEGATIAGDLLYIRLLIADEDGRSALDALAKDRAPATDPDNEGGRDHLADIRL
jgi:hypothetical protein